MDIPRSVRRYRREANAAKRREGAQRCQVGFFLGFILFGIVTQCAGLLPPQTGMLLAIGSPLFLVGGALGQVLYDALWIVAILGTLFLGLGLVWAGYWLWSSKEALV